METLPDQARILHVDDNPQFAETAATFLRREDERFTVATASSADAGLDWLRDGEFDCLVSDYDMPGRNGIEFLRAVRERHPELPFILYTGKGSEEVAADAISAGVTDYLQKQRGTDQYTILANRIRNAVSARRSATAVERSQYRLEQMLKAVPSCVVQLNYQGEFIFANERAIDVLGLEETALTDRTYNDPEWEIKDVDGNRIPDEELPFRQVRDSGEPLYGFRHAIEWPDGTRKILEVNGVPLFDDAGDVDTVVFSLTDITGRWEHEKRLQQTTARLQALFSNSPDMINVHDRDGNIIDPNPRLCEATGYDAAELREMKIWELDEQINPQNAHALWEGMDTGDSRKLEGVYRRKDGSTLPVEIHVRRLDLEGQDRFVVISRDATERKAQEQERVATIEFLQSLYDVATDRTLTADEKITRLLELGPEKLALPYGHLTRIERAGDRQGERSQTIIEASGNGNRLQPGASCPISESYCRKTIEQDGLLEIRDALAAGWADDPPYETFALGCYIGTAITVDDELYGTVFFASDAPREEPFTSAERTFVRLMSQLVSYELERKQATNELERQNERLAEFASVVSHDLQNPLRVANGRLELARESQDSEHLDAVARAHERMDALIDDLLTLAREGEQLDDLQPVDIGALAEDCWRNVATVDATFTTETDRQIQADRTRLQQLLENLMRNAVEHGGEVTRLTVGELDDGFYVEDDGRGVPEGQREEIFEAGYSTATDGTGFGLSIVEEVTHAHGWAVAVTDGSEGGARFEITGVTAAGE